MEFSRPEYWSGKSFPSPADLPNSGIEPRSPALQAGSLPTELSGNTEVDCHSLLQENLPDPEIEPGSLALAGGFLTEPTGKP